MNGTAIISDIDTHEAFSRSGFSESQFYTRETPFGYSNYLHFFENGDNSFITISRLGEGQDKKTHHFVNYKADIWALKELGIKRIISLSAARELTSLIIQGQLFLPEDVMESKSTVAKEYFDSGKSRAICPDPSFCPGLRQKAMDVFASEAVISKGNLALTMDSRFETTLEKKLLLSFDCLATSQPLYQEFWLVHEMKFCYLSLCLIKNSSTFLSLDDISPYVNQLVMLVDSHNNCQEQSCIDQEQTSPEWWRNL